MLFIVQFQNETPPLTSKMTGHNLLKQRKNFSQFSFNFQTFDYTRTHIRFQTFEQCFSLRIIFCPQARNSRLKASVNQKWIVNKNGIFKQLYLAPVFFTFIFTE